MTHIIFTLCRTDTGGFGSARSWHAVWLVAARAEAMRPILSSNATSQMEGKPIGHIHYVCFIAPHGVFQDGGVGLFCGQRWSIVFFIMCGEIGGFNNVVDKQGFFFSNCRIVFLLHQAKVLSYLCLL